MAQRQQSATTTTTTSDDRTVIGAGIQVNGRVSGEEDLHVEGRLEGSVALTETFYVAAAGTVVAGVLPSKNTRSLASSARSAKRRNLW